jgi:hypothetical protein
MRMKKNKIQYLTAIGTTVSRLKRSAARFLAITVGMVCTTWVEAQTGIAGGLSAATSQVKSAYTYVGPLILAIGGVVGLSGGIRVYIKWNNGERDINKELVGWAGSCVFLLLVGTILTAFFG